MKKVILLLLLAWGVAESSAQITLTELLGGKVTEGNKATSSVISDAVAPALTVIRQQYRLERGGEYFGKNHRAYYGETYTLGVKVSGATVIQRGVVLPWECDTDYQRVEQGGKYKPSIYWSLQQSISDSIWKPVELEIGTQYVTPIDEDSLLFRHVDALSDFGLSVDETEGLKKGHIIWAYTNTDVPDSTMQVSLRLTSYQIDVTADSTYYSVAPTDAERVIGGVFVVPVIERAGVIKLQLAAIASMNKDRNWVLYSLMKRNRTTETITNDTTKKEKQKKGSKRDTKAIEAADSIEPTPIN